MKKENLLARKGPIICELLCAFVMLMAGFLVTPPGYGLPKHETRLMAHEPAVTVSFRQLQTAGCFAYSAQNKQFACTQFQKYGPISLQAWNLSLELVGSSHESFTVMLPRRGPYISLGTPPAIISLDSINKMLRQGKFVPSQVTAPMKLPVGQWVPFGFTGGKFRVVVDKTQAPWGEGINYRLDYLCIEGTMVTLVDGTDDFADFWIQVSKDSFAVALTLRHQEWDDVRIDESKTVFGRLAGRCQAAARWKDSL